MALLNKDEFAGICRTTVPIINTNIHRGKVIWIADEKVIDTEDLINKAFFKKYKKIYEDKLLMQQSGETIEKIYNKVVQKVENKTTATNKQAKVEKSKAKSKETMEWTERKLQADTLLQEAKAEKEILNLQKLAGKLIPIDLVFNILNIHNHDIFATFQNDAENLASVYCDILAGGDRKKLAEISTKLSERLNDAVRRAKEVSVSSLEAAIDDYSEVRSRGEKK